MRVLLVEDDHLLGDGLSAGLMQMGYTVDWIMDGIKAEDALQDKTLDLLILDISLPGQDGLSLLRKIRQQGNNIPVLLLTARDGLNDRIIGLDSGADDYLIKPFDLEELAARLRAISRRKGGRSTPLLSYGDITLDPAGRTVERQGEPISCTSREYAILEALLMNPGQILTRQRLEEALYGWDDGVESNAIEVYIHHLRRKLGKSIIQTIRGVGYKIPKINN
ncbi:MAG: response regulator [Sedimenticola sp.]|uniref:Response regulator n=1 Tax=Sedimenticola thiotaurini TaxID=1543721 RepID=A0A558CPV3_9GAMM|nr:response regulator [Sedimenticola sp.]MCW8949637.1 response regulator [Sedimenticola sp.]MCW9022764.1 response regulator [Sedimenticola sp.]MDF1528137.1 response regulator [Sedimenticola sp.]TVT50682.1 MAG: response regulator [Sedimenticola thiotaurini]